MAVRYQSCGVGILTNAYLRHMADHQACGSGTVRVGNREQTIPYVKRTQYRHFEMQKWRKPILSSLVSSAQQRAMSFVNENPPNAPAGSRPVLRAPNVNCFRYYCIAVTLHRASQEQALTVRRSQRVAIDTELAH